MQDGELEGKGRFFEQMLHESEEKYRLLVENSPNLIGILQDGLLKYVNKTACEKLGWTFEEMLSPSFDPIETVIPPRLRERTREIVARRIFGKNIPPYELSLLKREGSEITVMSYSQRIIYRGRPADEIVFVDITDRKRVEQALKESELRYKAMFESMGSAVAVYEATDNGRDFIIRDFNSAAEKIEQVRREDVIQQSVLKAFPGVKEFGLFDVFQRVWKTGKPEHYPAKLYKDHMTAGWRDNYVYKLPSGQVVSIYEDVTERMKMLEEIERLAKFPTENPSPIFRLGLDGTILDANKASESLLQNWKCKVGEKAPLFLTNMTNELYANQLKKNMDIQVSDRTFLFTLVPIKDARYVNAYGRDITERRQIENRYRNTLESMFEGCQIIGFDWRYLYVNDAAARHGRRTKEDLLGHTMMEAYPDIEQTEMFGVLKRCMRERVMQRMVNEFVFPDGTKGWFELSIQPVPEGIFMLSHDITDRKMAEQAVQRRLEYEEVLSRISSRFAGVADIDSSVEASLADMGRLTKASRTYLFLFRENRAIMDNTHEWCAEGVSPQIKNLQNLSTDRFLWWMTKLRNGETIQIEDASKMPPEAKEEQKILLQDQEKKSLLVVPLNIREELAGFIGFDNVTATHPWHDNDAALLKVCSKIVGDALERDYMEKSLRRHSEHLEELVEARTREIAQLNQSISDRLLRKIQQIQNISRLRDNLRKVSDTSIGVNVVLDECMKDFEMDAGAVLVFDKKSRVANVRAFRSRIEGITLNESYPMDPVLCGCELLTLDKTVSKIEGKSCILGTTSIHCAPIHLGKKVHGSLILGTQKALTLDESDLTVLRLYANLASTIFEIQNLTVTPAKEPVQEGKGEVAGTLELGTTYLVKNEVEKALEFFAKTALSGVEGLCITREYPPKMRQKYGLKKTPIIWLSEEKVNGEITVYSLQDLSASIGSFVEKVNRGVVLLDGVEYLITNNGFESFLRFLQMNRSRFEAKDSVLIIAVAEGTISDRELRLIERETETLKISYR
jgi:PAS domain S-box-containing protein